MIPIETAGTAKDVADKVRQGKAFLKIGQTPWGVQFYICESRTSANGSHQARHETFPLLTRLLFASMKAGIQTPSAKTRSRSDIGASPFAALAVLCAVSNLVAFTISSGLRSNYIELDPLVRAGSLLSLAVSEGIILAASIVLLVLVRDVVERTVLQGLVSGFFVADAVNDTVLVSTGNLFLATELAWATAAVIPAMVGISLLHRAGKNPTDESGSSPHQ